MGESINPSFKLDGRGRSVCLGSLIWARLRRRAAAVFFHCGKALQYSQPCCFLPFRGMDKKMGPWLREFTLRPQGDKISQPRSLCLFYHPCTYITSRNINMQESLRLHLEIWTASKEKQWWRSIWHLAHFHSISDKGSSRKYRLVPNMRSCTPEIATCQTFCSFIKHPF